MRILVSAAELSGDRLGTAILTTLQQRHTLILEGIGGPGLETLGLASMAPLSRLAVMGFWEVLPRLPELLWIRARMMRRLAAWKPDLLLTIDAPDFNLPLAQRAKKLGIPAVHLASPSVWAWRRDRIPRIAAALDHLLCLFPFEPALYAGTGLQTTFIGHPLARTLAHCPDPTEARTALGLPMGPVLACLPGSRVNEVRALWPTFRATLSALKALIPALHVAVPVATPDLQSWIAAHEDTHWIHLIPGQAPRVLAASTAALVASGTASLEAVLTGRPTVVAYRMNPRTYQKVQGQLLTSWVSLPNQLANQHLVPEFIQDAMTVDALVTALMPRLTEAPDPAFLAITQALHQTLASPEPERAVAAIEETLAHAHRH